MSDSSILSARRICCALACIFLSGVAAAQGIPDERNTNIIGINAPGTPDPGWVPVADTGNKQQNEAACSHKPAFPLHIICVFNDYRGVDNPLIADAWEGWAWSLNGGQTFFSDLLPAHPGDSPNIGFEFAADPQVTAAPGVALVSYIAADRGDHASGGLFALRLFERNLEGGAPWAPEMLPVQVANTNAGQFVDKPYQLLHLAPPGSGTVTVSSTLKDGTPVSQEVPAARLFIAYTTFLHNKTKLNVAWSDNYGESWRATKLSEGQAVNQSASLAAHGDDVCAVWRRFEWKKQSDAILVACSSNRGNRWSKSRVISEEPEFIPFDQGTTETTFRTNSYPVIVSDGAIFYAFWSSRDPDSPLFYARIVYSMSTDGGATWSTPAMLDNVPDGHQYQVSAAVARGEVQVAWYDTRNDLFQGQFIQDLIGEIAGVSEPSDTDKVIRHQGDMRTTKIIAGVPQPSVQVSRYLHGVRSDTPTGTVERLEFNFLNDRLFQIGTVPFDGDFAHVSAPLYRLEDGDWVSNAPAADVVVPVDFLLTWTDARDVGGNVWEDLSTPTTYTPANLMPMEMGADGDDPADVDSAEPATKLAAASESDAESTLELGDPTVVRVTGAAASMKNEAAADAEPDPAFDNPMCVPGPAGGPFTYTDRSRNQNVYANVVRPGASFDSPSADKPTGSVQRAHVIWISNNTDATVTYTVTIDDQPGDAPDHGRASFLQTPIAPFDVNDPSGDGLLTELEVRIERDSTVARTVFITSDNPHTPINVSVSDGGATVLGTITLNPDVLTPNVQNPNVQNTDPSNPNIQNGEVHNPNIQNDPVVISVSNPNVQNPNVQNPNVQNPNVQNRDVPNPNVQNPNVQNPNVQNESLEGRDMENPDTGYNPEPGDELTAAERMAGYTDITWDTTNTGNTTTAFNLDAFVNGDTSNLKTQLIATRTQTTETARNCTQYLQVQNQVIFNLTNPDLSLLERNTTDLIFGDGSAYIAPGEQIFVTLRVWGDPDFPVERTGVRVEAQSCNYDDPDLATGECDPPFDQVGDPDAPPVISVPSSPVLLEAANEEGDIGAYSEEPISAVDDVDASVDILCEAGEDSDSGTDLFDMVIFFELGDTEVTCYATDSAGNTAEESFIVRVQDTTPPEINYGDDNSDFVFNTCSTTYEVWYQDDDPDGDDVGLMPWVTAYDTVDESPELVCDPPSGSNQSVFPYPPGGVPTETEVECTATDFIGNETIDTFTVIVTNDC